MMPNTHIFYIFFFLKSQAQKLHTLSCIFEKALLLQWQMLRHYCYEVRCSGTQQSISNSIARGEYFESHYPLFWHNLLLTYQKTMISSKSLINILKLERSVRRDSMSVFKGITSLSLV